MRQDWAMPGGAGCAAGNLGWPPAWGDLATFMGQCVSSGHLQSVTGLPRYMSQAVGAGKWVKKESEQTVLVIAWPLLQPMRISTEKELVQQETEEDQGDIGVRGE